MGRAAIEPENIRSLKRCCSYRATFHVGLAWLLCALSMAAKADTILMFEDLPDVYFFSSGGQNVGSYYPGVTFGPNVTALSVSRFGGYASDAFPPHSGDVVIWDAFDPTINVTFDFSVVSFGIWYTSFDPLTLQAYDSSENLLGTVVGDPNTDGTTGTSSFLSFSDPAIAAVSLTSSAGDFVLDDLNFASGGTTAPEPSSLILVATIVLFLRCRLRRRGSVRPRC